MNKQNLLRILDGISYLAIINATVFVLLFQNSASMLLLTIALISYVVAFVLGVAFCLTRIIFSKNQERESEFFVSKKQKVWTIVRLVLSVAILSFVIFLFFAI